jgi:hypothetical protein
MRRGIEKSVIILRAHRRIAGGGQPDWLRRGQALRNGGSGGNFAGSSGSNFDSSDLEPLCAIAPNALVLAVRAIARGRQSFEGVKEFVSSQGTGVVITGSCKALVTGLIHNPNEPLSSDLKLPQGVVDDLTNTRTGLMQCLNWDTASDRVRCFSGEIPPP